LEDVDRINGKLTQMQTDLDDIKETLAGIVYSIGSLQTSLDERE
jgi:hypothetical protein